MPHQRSIHRGFTLVEVVLAVAIFSFAIMGVVFLLGTGLQSSVNTQRDSALSSALMTSAAVLRTYDSTAAPTTLNFDQTGSRVTDLKNAYYTFSPTLTGSTGSLSNVELYCVKVSAPYPSTNSVGQFLISRLKK